MLVAMHFLEFEALGFWDKAADEKESGYGDGRVDPKGAIETDLFINEVFNIYDNNNK